MRYRVIISSDAEAELDNIYDYIAAAAGTQVAGDYLHGLISFIEKLETFPERGTVRPSRIPRLRIIGYRRSVSVVFTINGSDVHIVGVFRRGQNIDEKTLQARYP